MIVMYSDGIRSVQKKKKKGALNQRLQSIYFGTFHKSLSHPSEGRIYILAALSSRLHKTSTTHCYRHSEFPYASHSPLNGLPHILAKKAF